MQDAGQKRPYFAFFGPLALAFLLIAWVAGTGSVWLFVTYYRKIPSVRYADLLLPSRWTHYRIARGDHYATEGERALRQGDLNAAIHLLRSGLALNPSHARSRLLLANLYSLAQNPKLADEVLITGLGLHQHDPDYLRAAFLLWDKQQNDSLILAQAHALLAVPAPLPAACRSLIAFWGAQAAYHLGQHDQARTLLRLGLLENSAPGTCLLAKMEWAEGFTSLALGRLQAYQRGIPAPNESVGPLFNQFLQALGRDSEWHTNLLADQIRRPDDPRSHVALLRYFQATQKNSSFAHSFHTSRHQFSHHIPALLELAEAAANAGRPDLVDQIALPNPKTPDHQAALNLLLAEAHLQAGTFAQTLACLDQNASLVTPPFRSAQAGLRAAALYALGRADEAHLQIDYLLSSPDTSADSLVALAQRLNSLGQHEPARLLFTRALALSPRHQPALLALITLELDNGTLVQHPEHLSALLSNRRPPRELLQRITDELGRDRHLLWSEQTTTLAALRPALAAAWPRADFD